MEETLNNHNNPDNSNIVLADGLPLVRIRYRTDIHRSVIFDLVSFINLFDIPRLSRKGRYRYFEQLRDNWITTDMQTIWQLSHESAKESCSDEVIGWDDMAGKKFFLTILDGLVKANPKFAYMLGFLNKVGS